MNDNAFLALIIPVLGSGLADAGVASIKVKQSFQPTQQGAESGPAVYLHKIGDMRRGSAAVSERWDAGLSAMIRTETQQMETTWQVDARVPQDPADETALTPADVVNTAAMLVTLLAVLHWTDGHRFDRPWLLLGRYGWAPVVLAIVTGFWPAVLVGPLAAGFAVVFRWWAAPVELPWDAPPRRQMLDGWAAWWECSLGAVSVGAFWAAALV